MEVTKGADFVTAWFVMASAEWQWYNTISPFVQHPYNCMMQLCRVSRRALTLLLEKRRALGERFLLERRDPNSWPNDEAFVAATLVEQGLRTALFSEHAPNFRHAGTFTFVKPTSARWLEHLPLNDTIYHPVEHGDKFVARAKAYLNMRNHTNPSGDHVSPDTDDELLEQIHIESQTKSITERDFRSASAQQSRDPGTDDPD